MVRGAVYVVAVGLATLVIMERTFEFDLVAEGGELVLTDVVWSQVKFWLLEIQPARRVELRGNPPARIHVESWGADPEVAQMLLDRLEELCGVHLRVEF